MMNNFTGSTATDAYHTRMLLCVCEFRNVCVCERVNEMKSASDATDSTRGGEKKKEEEEEEINSLCRLKQC